MTGHTRLLIEEHRVIRLKKKRFSIHGSLMD